MFILNFIFPEQYWGIHSLTFTLKSNPAPKASSSFLCVCALVFCASPGGGVLGTSRDLQIDLIHC